MTTPRRAPLAIGLLPIVAAGTFLAGCGDDTTTTAATTTSAAPSTTVAEAAIDPGDGGDYQPTITADDFVAEIDNPYLPLRPGARWVYEGTSEDGEERIVVEVLDERHNVFGVSAVVVRDQVFLEGDLIEDTLDWYAQDQDGNVWYLGEDTAEYEDGEVVSTEGSWAAGIDGALPGIVMLAAPAVGDTYRQEYLVGEAEDMGEVLAVGDSVTIPSGTYDDVLVTEDWTPLEPEIIEHKSYAPGVGQILEVKVTGPEERVELVEFHPGP